MNDQIRGFYFLTFPWCLYGTVFYICELQVSVYWNGVVVLYHATLAGKLEYK